MFRTKKTVGAAGVWILIGCASDSHAEQVRDARMAQAEERADVQESMVEERADTREERTADAYDQREERIEQGNAPGEDPAEELAELSEERAEFQNEAREELDKQAVHIEEAQQKIAAMGHNAPHSLQHQLSTAQAGHGLATQEVSKLESATAATWESDKRRVEQRLAELESQLSALDDEIDDQ